MRYTVTALVILLVLVLTLAVNAFARSSPTPANAPLRVVIVGLVHGHISGFLEHYRKVRTCRSLASTSPTPTLATQYANRFSFPRDLLFTDLDSMLAKTKPQAALVYTSTLDHREAVEICARHHVAVMMEKPLAVRMEDARAIEQAANSANIPVMVNYETTWYPSNRAVYEMVRKGELGDIRKVVVHDGHRGPKEINVQPEFLNWLTDPKQNGAGALFDFGCYGADLMTWLMNGKRPTSVTAVVQQIKPEIYPKVDDEATVILTYPHAQAIIQASWNWPFDRKDMEVYGQSGYAITVARDQVRVRRAGAQESLETAKSIPAPEDDPVAYLRAVVLGGLKPQGLGSLQMNMIVTEILDAARRSAQTGKTIQLGGAD